MLPDRKTTYHSELVREGRLHVKLLSSPAPSKYPEKPDYCKAAVENDALPDRTIMIENAAVEAVLAACPLNTPIWIQFVGGSETAAVNAWTEAGEAIEPIGSAPVRQQPPKQAGGWGTTPAQPAPSASTTPPSPAAPASDSFERDLFRGLEAAWGAAAEFYMRHGRYPTTAEWISARSLMIDHRTRPDVPFGSPREALRQMEETGELPNPFVLAEESEKRVRAAGNGRTPVFVPRTAGAPLGADVDEDDDLPF
jgi:hypothetical protein